MMLEIVLRWRAATKFQEILQSYIYDQADINPSLLYEFWMNCIVTTSLRISRVCKVPHVYLHFLQCPAQFDTLQHRQVRQRGRLLGPGHGTVRRIQIARETPFLLIPRLEIIDMQYIHVENTINDFPSSYVDTVFQEAETDTVSFSFFQLMVPSRGASVVLPLLITKLVLLSVHSIPLLVI